MVSRNLNFKTVEEARVHINKSKMIVNPSNTTIKEKRFVIVADNKNDEQMLKQALVGMKNVKWIDILFQETKEKKV
mgnify:FL=1|jgi:soluble P-type ATPase|tara:strand:- start:693 stop:920 length:228 start_codon:yes stop_codon:yes gene_type:complete